MDSQLVGTPVYLFGGKVGGTGKKEVGDRRVQEKLEKVLNRIPIIFGA